MSLSEIVKNISGWGDFSNIHSFVFEKIPDNSIVIELGIASGRGLAMMAYLAKGRNIKVYGIDHFLGTRGESRDFYFNDSDGISKDNVIKNLKTVGIEKNEYEIIIGDTVSSSYLFAKANYVFIDADHSYEGANLDIITWWPKIVSGGFLGGHDWPFTTVQKAVKENFSTYNIIDDCWLAGK